MNKNPLEDSEMNRVENNVKIFHSQSEVKSDFEKNGLKSHFTDSNTAKFGNDKDSSRAGTNLTHGGLHN